MQFYRTLLALKGVDPEMDFFGTATEAHEGAKKHPKECWPQLVIDLLDIPTDKAALVELLNHREPQGTKLLRQWGLSPRGGLMEVADAADMAADAGPLGVIAPPKPAADPTIRRCPVCPGSGMPSDDVLAEPGWYCCGQCKMRFKPGVKP